MYRAIIQSDTIRRQKLYILTKQKRIATTPKLKNKLQQRREIKMGKIIYTRVYTFLFNAKKKHHLHVTCK